MISLDTKSYTWLWFGDLFFSNFPKGLSLAGTLLLHENANRIQRFLKLILICVFSIVCLGKEILLKV